MTTLLALVLALQAATPPSPEAPSAPRSALRLEIASSDERGEQPIEIDLIPEGPSGRRVLLRKLLPSAPRSEVFRIDELPPGRYRVAVFGSALAREERRVDIPAKGIASLDLIRLSPGASLTVHISDSSRSPLRRVRVLLAGTQGSVSGETDAEGGLVLKGLRRGASYTWFLSDDVHFQLQGEWNGEARLDKAMAEATSLSGRVVDPSGEPVGDVRLGFARVSKGSGGGGGSPYKTGPDGRFLARAPSPETNRLLLNAFGFLPLEREIPLQKDGSPIRELDLGTLRLERGRAVRGRVVGAATGLPIKGARLTVQESREPAGDFHPHLDQERVTSDEDGAFEFRAVPPGTDVSLLVDKEGFARRLLPLSRDETAPVEVALTAGGRVDVTVCGSPAELSRSVVDVETPGMSTPFFSRPLDAEGRYVFENVTPGRVVVHRSWRAGDGFMTSALTADARSEVRVEEGATSWARIACGPIPVAGTVFVDGKPAADILISVLTGRMGCGVSALTDSVGRVQIRVDVPGSYSAWAVSPRLVSRETCTVPNGGRADCTFELRAPASSNPHP